MSKRSRRRRKRKPRSQGPALVVETIPLTAAEVKALTLCEHCEHHVDILSHERGKPLK